MKKLVMLCLLLSGLVGAGFANASALWNTAEFSGTFTQAGDTRLFYPNYAVQSNSTYFGARLFAGNVDIAESAVIKVFDTNGTQLATRDYYDAPSNQFIAELFGPGTAFDGVPLPAGDYIVELSFLPLIGFENFPINWQLFFYSELDRENIAVSLTPPPPNPSGVPIPAAAWLLGSVLLGFIGLKRWRI